MDLSLQKYTSLVKTIHCGVSSPPFSWPLKKWWVLKTCFFTYLIVLPRDGRGRSTKRVAHVRVAEARFKGCPYGRAPSEATTCSEHLTQREIHKDQVSFLVFLAFGNNA